MNQSDFVQQNADSVRPVPNPVRGVELVDDHRMSHENDPTDYVNYDHDAHVVYDDQDLGDVAQEKLNNAGHAIKRTAEKIGDKAGELKDMTKEKIQKGVDAIKHY